MGDAITPARFLEEAKKQEIDLRIVGIADCHVSCENGGHVIWKGEDLKENVYCPAYQPFFDHALERMEQIADQLAGTADTAARS